MTARAVNVLLPLAYHLTSSPHQQYSFKSKSSKNRILGAIQEFLGAVKMAVKLSLTQTSSLSITILVCLLSVVLVLLILTRV